MALILIAGSLRELHMTILSILTKCSSGLLPATKTNSPVIIFFPLLIIACESYLLHWKGLNSWNMFLRPTLVYKYIVRKSTIPIPFAPLKSHSVSLRNHHQNSHRWSIAFHWSGYSAYWRLIRIRTYFNPTLVACIG
jgi:hypothetical protein